MDSELEASDRLGVNQTSLKLLNIKKVLSKIRKNLSFIKTIKTLQLCHIHNLYLLLHFS